MLTVGLVSVDPGRKWIGGRYYLQHVVRAVSALPAAERVAFFDVWWMAAPDDDPFAEVRELLAGRVIVAPPAGLAERAARKIRRTLRRSRDAGDLFQGIDVLFPILPAENPGVPLVFWMPDFQPWRMPELFSDDLRKWYETYYLTNGAQAVRIVVSSEDGLRDLRVTFPQFEAKARVLHFCSVPTEEWWQRDPPAVAREYALPEKFFLLANQFSHHKNHLVAFEAVRFLRQRGLPVVVACTGSTYGFRGDDYLQRVRAFLEQHHLGDAIRILDLIPRADQVALMRRSIGILQPSRFEGWSTVVEDAKTLGKPIVVSDIAVHREQAPARATFAPPDDPNAWADALEALWLSRSPGQHRDEETEGGRTVAQSQLEMGRTFISIVHEAHRAGGSGR